MKIIWKKNVMVENEVKILFGTAKCITMCAVREIQDQDSTTVSNL